ncbi:DUF167 domain-containing protein [Botrimarina mediterranea]|uniref:DUF167 domain-containing protein n=1 Tax=Botrimarina mediterranea TaxID=2528022 RepID=UPI00118BF39C|nr:hypothetical protein K2D_15280 [Planctomycetes bacterium K2D]
MSDTVQSTVEAAAEGVVIRVRAQPGARRNGVTGVREAELCVAVTAPPDKGRANDAIVKVVAKSIGVPRTRVKILSGETNRHKRLAVDGVTVVGVVDALRAAIGLRI